jgi:hypothetical protein
MLSFFSGMSTAADIEAGVVKVVNIKKHSPLSVDSPYSMSEITLKSSFNEISTKAAATGITYFEIGNIYSSNYGWETILASQFSTADHGGSTLYIYIWQFGYGNVTNATMNGISRSAGLTEYRCGNNLHVCAVGETVTGWLYGFDFSGQQFGHFSVGSNSTASPFGYWSDSVYIN